MRFPYGPSEMFRISIPAYFVNSREWHSPSQELFNIHPLRGLPRGNRTKCEVFVASATIQTEAVLQFPMGCGLRPPKDMYGKYGKWTIKTDNLTFSIVSSSEEWILPFFQHPLLMNTSRVRRDIPERPKPIEIANVAWASGLHHANPKRKPRSEISRNLHLQV